MIMIMIVFIVMIMVTIVTMIDSHCSDDGNDSISTSMTQSCGPLARIILMINSLWHMTGSSQ